jgi:uncharacterized protein (TIGR03435 family)
MDSIRLAVMLVAASWVVVSAQAPTGIPTSTNVAFEVASVKPNNSGSDASSTSGRPGSFTATNVTARELIVFGYRLREFQIATGPGWITSDHFDIVARAPENVTTDNRAMVRALLRDRFKLAAHMETQQGQIYSLTMARSDRRLGPQIKPTAVNCTPPQPGAPGACGMNTFNGRMVGTGQSMAQLATTLASFGVHRTVLDRTELKGSYDFELRWTPDTSTSAGAANDAPSIFAALQEQLGLKLDAERGTVEMLIVDSIERPTPD